MICVYFIFISSFKFHYISFHKLVSPNIKPIDIPHCILDKLLRVLLFYFNNLLFGLLFKEVFNILFVFFIPLLFSIFNKIISYYLSPKYLNSNT